LEPREDPYAGWVDALPLTAPAWSITKLQQAGSKQRLGSQAQESSEQTCPTAVPKAIPSPKQQIKALHPEACLQLADIKKGT
jgi:hypothetical protein